MKDYDVIIVGAGPAGLTAGLYTARAGLSSQVIEKALIGGQITYAETVENYPGFVSGISGLELTQLMHEQATKYGLETLMAEVTGIEPIDERRKIVRTSAGDFEAKAVIIAAGSARRRLDVPGEAEFTGRGVSYCATCDGAFFRDRVVAVVGGGNVAITEALHLSRFAQRIIVIHRRDKLRAGAILQKKAFSEPKIEFQWDSVVERVCGGDFVTSLGLRQVKSREQGELPVDGVFIAIGLKPETDYLRDMLILDETGHIVTSETMATRVSGIFAAGDIRHNSARQAICACGDGATAAIYAEKLITE